MEGGTRVTARGVHGNAWELIGVEPFPKKSDYLEMMLQAEESGWATYDQEMDQWKQIASRGGPWGYNQAGPPLCMATVDAVLYRATGDLSFARKVVGQLVDYGKYTSYASEELRKSRVEYEDGIPPFSAEFGLWAYLYPYVEIKDLGLFNDSEKRAIEANAELCINSFILRWPEWGAHNRTTLRAWGLALAAKAFPENPRASEWRQLADSLAADSLGHWNMEDATQYNALWMYSLINYADHSGLRDRLFRDPHIRCYMDYFLRLMSPQGMIPDFGDSVQFSGWYLLLPVFERAATEYRDPRFKWAAGAIFNRVASKGPDGKWDLWWEGNVASHWHYLHYAYGWADDGVGVEVPEDGSEEVLDDLVGKKMVFRSGWGKDDTYLLLNYCDEGDHNLVQRDYLRSTISLGDGAEKCSHGHADENTLSFLVSGRTVLLHESGYREQLPNGRYRADYYHNRVVARADAYSGQSLIDFLGYSGLYKKTTTQKVYFASFPDADMSRTRVTDQDTGWQGDRVVAYLKDLDVFVVMDAVMALRPGRFTFVNLLYTTDILKQGEGFYDTWIGQIRGETPQQLWHNCRDRSLLISFPLKGHGYFDSTFGIRRCYLDEIGVCQGFSGAFRQGVAIPFVTVLWPHEYDGDVQDMVSSVSVMQTSLGDAVSPKGVGVRIQRGGRNWVMGTKLDLEQGRVPQEVRPKYTYEAGRVGYDEFETDAGFFLARYDDKTVDFAMVDGIGLRMGGTPLFTAKEATIGTLPDGRKHTGRTRWRTWHGTVTRK